MHRQLRTLLDDAQGESDLVVVVFLDVRGFSTFAGMAESSEAALFLRRMYMRILDDYFPDAAFFKPTGDGLMIIRHIDSPTLDRVVQDSIRQSLQLVEDFQSISKADPMINFDVPTELGIGIARGAATRLASGDMTLDYSGRPLNLAARLMDLARPSGVVVDDRVLKGLQLDASLPVEMKQEEVYVKGIADIKPIFVSCSPDVVIRSSNRRPLTGELFDQKLENITYRKLRTRPRFIHALDKTPIDPDSVTLKLMVPVPDGTGKRDPSIASSIDLLPTNATRTPHGWEIAFDYSKAIEFCEFQEVKLAWSIRQILRYNVVEEKAIEETTPEVGGRTDGK